MSQGLLDPHEWDFRGVEEHAIKCVVAWEYARSNTTYRKRVEHWLSSEVCGRKVATWLRSQTSVPLEMCQAIHNTVPWASSAEIGRMLIIYGQHWPSAWPKLLDRFSGDIPLGELRTVGRPSMMMLPASELMATDFETQPGEYAWLVKVKPSEFKGIDRAVTAVSSAMRDQLRRLGALGPRGKQGQAPFDELKSLAAFRLVKSGLSYREAQRYVQSYRQSVSGKSVGDVLPIYASSGAWSNAARKAERALTAFF